MWCTWRHEFEHLIFLWLFLVFRVLTSQTKSFCVNIKYLEAEQINKNQNKFFFFSFSLWRADSRKMLVADRGDAAVSIFDDDVKAFYSFCLEIMWRMFF